MPTKWLHKHNSNEAKQDKYTVDPGRQIYISNKKKYFGQKWFLNNKIQKMFLGKIFFDKNFFF